MSGEHKEKLTPEEAYEEIERVGKALGEPRWWESLVKNQADADAVFQLAKQYGYREVKKGELEKIKQFVEKLGEGIYIGPLESYDVHWSGEKIARDIWQNFFDGNDQTLDGIMPRITPAKYPYHTVHIEGAQEYDFRKLLHFGGTSKEGNTKAAGGFGEGAKIAAFLLLRDHKVDTVRFGSGDWVLEYYLASVPEEQYDKPVRGLHVRLKKTAHRAGNFVEFDGLPHITASIQDARDLFYHKDNPDFKFPTFALSPMNLVDLRIWDGI